MIDLAALRRNLDILREGRSMTMIMGIDHAEALLRVVEAYNAAIRACRKVAACYSSGTGYAENQAAYSNAMNALDEANEVFDQDAPFLPGKEGA